MTVQIAKQRGLPRLEDGSVDRGLLATELSDRILAENREACMAVVGSPLPVLTELEDDELPPDWKAFFEALIEFLERLMPLILQLIEMFGGLSAVFTKTGTMVACVFFLVRPSRHLAA
jgi:hypothetical protein